LRRHLDIAMYLVDRINNKNPKNNLGTTPLHEAAKKGHINVVKYIVANIDEKNPSDKRGNTPRKLAISNQHFDIAKLLNSCIKLIPRSKLL
jgi:ankyrin repeat protein